MKNQIEIGQKYWFKIHGVGEITGFTTRSNRKSCNVRFVDKNTIFSEKYIKEKCNLHCGVDPDPEISKDEKKELHTLYERLEKVQTIEEYRLIVDGITKIRIHDKFARCLNKKGSKIEGINRTIYLKCNVMTRTSNKTFTINKNKTKVENIEHSLNTFIHYVHRINKKNNTVKIVELKYNHSNSGVGVIYYLNNIEQRLKIKHEFFSDYFILSVVD